MGEEIVKKPVCLARVTALGSKAFIILHVNKVTSNYRELHFGESTKGTRDLRLPKFGTLTSLVLYSLMSRFEALTTV